MTTRRTTPREQKALEILEGIRWAEGITPWTRSATGTVRSHDTVAAAAYYLAGNPGATIHAFDPREDELT